MRRMLRRDLLLLFLLVPAATAFAPSARSIRHRRRSFLQSTAINTPADENVLVVISPPGGVGQEAAVQAAKGGNKVKWFVVGGGDRDVSIAQHALDSINGKLELAGATADSLLMPPDNPESALSAVSTWCQGANALLVTGDGSDSDEDAIKVAARQAATSLPSTAHKVGVVSSEESFTRTDEEEPGLVGGLVEGIFGGSGKVEVPASLKQALGSSTQMIRHGALFGMPQSSPDFSAMMGGPRKFPELTPEYLSRSVRVDAGRASAAGTSASRHAIGELAALLALNKVESSDALPAEISVSSQPGTEPTTLETWNQEFTRVTKEVQQKQEQSGDGIFLFQADFGGVPNVQRLADWLETKWAPAVLRTYDIAAIRTGARPVYAQKSAETTAAIEVVWQELIDFTSKTVGKLKIQASNEGLIATRIAAQAGQAPPRKPLPAEDVLVQRLAEAASQAMEKGLATKPLPSKQPEPVAVVEPPKSVTSIQSSGTVTAAPPAAVSAQGPRTSGARRSTERQRGGKRKRRKQQQDEEPKQE